MSVQHFRLINGEEIISTVSRKTRKWVELVDPMSVELVATETGHVTTLVHYTPYSRTQPLIIERSKILAITNLHSSMVRFYYNSLILSDQRSERLIQSIEGVNAQMDMMIASMQCDQLLQSYAHHVAESPLFIHSEPTYTQ